MTPQTVRLGWVRQKSKMAVSRTDPSILDIKRDNRSDHFIIRWASDDPRGKFRSQTELQTNITYDDICAGHLCPSGLIFAADGPQGRRHIFVGREDTDYLASYRMDDDKMAEFLERKFLTGSCTGSKMNELTLKILWDTFRFTRDRSFNEGATMAALDAIHSTHLFMQSDPWRTVRDVYQQMRERILLYAVMDPPKSTEALSLRQCESVLEFFRKSYLEDLPLLRLLFHPNHRLILRL